MSTPAQIETGPPAAERMALMFAELQPGDTFLGKISKLLPFGALVERDGLVGLLHLSQISPGHIVHPSEVFTLGQPVECVILDLDREKLHITLGLKKRVRSPWDTILTRYPVGTRIQGKVTYVAPYGAFVEIERGVEGLLHISEMSSAERVANASQLYSNGQAVEAMVLSILVEERRLSLGTRQLEAQGDAIPARRVQ
jgi:small subunit ribosomal protein S1